MQVLCVHIAADGAAHDAGHGRLRTADGAPTPGGSDQAGHARGRHCLPRQWPLQGGHTMLVLMFPATAAETPGDKVQRRAVRCTLLLPCYA